VIAIASKLRILLKCFALDAAINGGIAERAQVRFVRDASQFARRAVTRRAAGDVDSETRTLMIMAGKGEATD
jgi:hypothetical protein